MPPLLYGASGLPASVVAASIALGVVVAIVGHLAGRRWIVIGGIAILFAASALMIAGGYLAYRDDPVDPRPCAEPGTC